MVPFRYNLRSLAVRKVSTAATVLGIALVVFVLAGSLMLSAGLRKTMAASGRDDVAIVVRKGAESELSSIVEDSQVSLIKAAPGVQLVDGKPLVIGEVVVVATMDKSDGSGVTNVQIRGVPPEARELRPEVHFIAGRPAEPGKDEAVIGKNLRGRFAGLDLGQTFEVKKNRPLRVVGVFESGGSAYESEIWVDFDLLREAFKRTGSVSSVRAKLESPAAFDGFQATVEQDQRLGLQALRERYFYEKQSEFMGMFLGILGSIVAVFFSFAAMIGATITMHAAIAHRQREIGVLRALGFRRRLILLAFLLESMFIGLLGGLLGAVASLGLGLVRFSTLNFQTFSEITFTFEPTPTILIVSVTFAIGMGLLGGLLPAARAARVSAVAAMRGA